MWTTSSANGKNSRELWENFDWKIRSRALIDFAWITLLLLSSVFFSVASSSLLKIKWDDLVAKFYDQLFQKFEQESRFHFFSITISTVTTEDKNLFWVVINKAILYLETVLEIGKRLFWHFWHYFSHEKWRVAFCSPRINLIVGSFWMSAPWTKLIE